MRAQPTEQGAGCAAHLLRARARSAVQLARLHLLGTGVRGHPAPAVPPCGRLGQARPGERSRLVSRHYRPLCPLSPGGAHQGRTCRHERAQEMALLPAHVGRLRAHLVPRQAH